MPPWARLPGETCTDIGIVSTVVEFSSWRSSVADKQARARTYVWFDSTQLSETEARVLAVHCVLVPEPSVVTEVPEPGPAQVGESATGEVPER